jgi:hypothetical protein
VANRSAVAIKLASLNQREVIDPCNALALASRSIGLNNYLYNRRPKDLVASDPEGAVAKSVWSPLRRNRKAPPIQPSPMRCPKTDTSARR